MSFLGQDEQIREYQFRFRYLYIALALAFLILFLRLWYLQVLNGERYRQAAEELRIKRVKVASPRGMIFDRNKKLLVDNRPAFDLEVTPQELYASKEWKKTIERLAKMIDAAPATVFTTLEKAAGQPKFLPIRIKQDLSEEEVARLEAHRLDLPGVNIQMDIKRTNLYQDLAAHLMGYIGEVNPRELPKLNKTLAKEGIPYKMGDTTGKFGLESRWEQVLRGINGEEYMEVDALGYRRKTSKSLASGLVPKASVPGKNLILTIDQDLQVIALEAFTKVLGDKRIGAVIALNPKNGEILTALSQPSFDPTAFARGVSSKLWAELLNNKNRPLRDKTIQDHYSPGSTFKPITAIAGLEEGVIDENTTFTCTGSLHVGNRVYRCWNKKGHGSVNVVQAIAQSCDVFFYRTGQKLGIDTLAKYAKMMGMGRKTGINLAHEEPGLIPTEEWKKKRFGQEWNPGETISCAIGQSYVLSTPLQLANAYAVISTGGFLWKPFLVKYIESPEGRILKEFQPEQLGKVTISKKTLDIVTKGLMAVVDDPRGTTHRYRIPGMDISGKTGTSQVINLSPDKVNVKCESMPFHFRDNALFAAFAPVEDPRIAVAVIAEHACHGASGAAPVAMAVIKKYLQKYMPEKYSDEVIKERLKKGTLVKAIEIKQPVSGEEEEPVRLNEVPEGPHPQTPVEGGPDDVGGDVAQ